MSIQQYGATILKPVIPDRLDSLRTLLISIGDDVTHYPDVPFTRLTSAHFLSWFIVEIDGVGPFLFFEQNDPALGWALSFPPRPFLVRYRSQVLAALAALLVVIVLGLIGLGVLAWMRYGPWPDVIIVAALAAIVGGFLALLRRHEETDSV